MIIFEAFTGFDTKTKTKIYTAITQEKRVIFKSIFGHYYSHQDAMGDPQTVESLTIGYAIITEQEFEELGKKGEREEITFTKFFIKNILAGYYLDPQQVRQIHRAKEDGKVLLIKKHDGYYTIEENLLICWDAENIHDQLYSFAIMDKDLAVRALEHLTGVKED